MMTFQLGAREDRPRPSKCQIDRASGLFDSGWYLEQYLDVHASRIDPLAQMTLRLTLLAYFTLDA